MIFAYILTSLLLMSRRALLIQLTDDQSRADMLPQQWYVCCITSIFVLIFWLILYSFMAPKILWCNCFSISSLNMKQIKMPAITINIKRNTTVRYTVRPEKKKKTKQFSAEYHGLPNVEIKEEFIVVILKILDHLPFARKFHSRCWTSILIIETRARSREILTLFTSSHNLMSSKPCSICRAED